MLAFSTVVVTFLAVAYSASAHPASLVSRGGGGGSTCSTGTVSCCNDIVPASSLKDDALLDGTVDLLTVLGTGLDLDAVVAKGGFLGLDCTAVDSCSAQTACCSDITTSGLIPIGLYCDPISL